MIEKGIMVAPGQWVKDGCVHGDPPVTKTYSAWVSGLCSPWIGWGQRAAEYARAVASGENAILQSIVNTRFGELFAVKGESPAWESVASLKTASNYRMGTVPDAVQFLTAGVDVQSNRLVVVVMGWSLKEGQREGYLVEYSELFGNTAYEDVWYQLEEEFLYREFGERNIIEMGIDSGYNPSKFARSENRDRNIIYDFCRKHRLRVLATKGSSHTMPQEFSMRHIDVHVSGRTNKAGLALFLINQAEIKKTIYNRLAWDLKKPGRWYFPVDTPDQFFQQLTSEEWTVKGEWRQIGENHVLDCMVINYFLALKNRRLFAEQSPMVVNNISNPNHRAENKTIRLIQCSSPPPGWD
jgi:phage terminase large subunit GpA-like protein